MQNKQSWGIPRKMHCFLLLAQKNLESLEVTVLAWWEESGLAVPHHLKQVRDVMYRFPLCILCNVFSVLSKRLLSVTNVYLIESKPDYQRVAIHYFEEKLPLQGNRNQK